MRKNYFSLINFLSWIIELFGRFHFSSFSPPRSRQEPKGRRKTAFLGGRERGEKSVMNGENGLKVYEEKFSSFCCFKEKFSFYIFVGWRKFFLFFRWSGENEKLCSLRKRALECFEKSHKYQFSPFVFWKFICDFSLLWAGLPRTENFDVDQSELEGEKCRWKRCEMANPESLWWKLNFMLRKLISFA